MSDSSTTLVANPLARVVSRIIRIAVGLAILAAGVGVAVMLVATRPVAPRVTRPDPLLQVRTMPATAADVPRIWEGYGTARGMNVAQIPAQVSGTVIERPAGVEAGLPISRPATAEPSVESAADAAEYLRALRLWAGRGLILQIEPTDYLGRYQSALEQAHSTRAQLQSLAVQEIRFGQMAALARQEREIQERELGRVIEADAQGGGNESEIERRRATLFQAQRVETGLLEQLDQIEPRRLELQARLRDQESAADVARQNLARTVVTSPIDGTLQDVLFRPGEWVPAGTPVARVVDLSRVEVPLRMSIAAGSSIAVGDPVSLRTDGIADLEFSGRVARLAPEADPQTRTFTVFVEVLQSPGGPAPMLLPGQFVVGRATTSGTQRVLLVPRRAVEEDAVYVAREAGPDAAIGSRVARRVPVSVLFNLVGDRPDLDPVETQWSAVRADVALDEGAPIIVSNLDDLHDGLLVGVAGGATAAGTPASSAPGAGARP